MEGEVSEYEVVEESIHTQRMKHHVFGCAEAGTCGDPIRAVVPYRSRGGRRARWGTVRGAEGGQCVEIDSSISLRS